MAISAEPVSETMDTMSRKDFEKLLRRIQFNQSQYAEHLVRDKDVATLNKEERREFMSLCHRGFDTAQDEILKWTLDIQSSLKLHKHSLADANKLAKEARPAARSLVENRIRLLESRQRVLSRLQDALAWQILGSNNVLIRSTQISSRPRQDSLNEASLRSMALAASHIKQPGDFVLINDLTTCLGPGAADLIHLSISGKPVRFIEVKEGKENETIFNVLKGLEKVPQYRLKTPEELAANEEFATFVGQFNDIESNPSKKAQFERVVRQAERVRKVLDYERDGMGESIQQTKAGRSTGMKRRAQVINTPTEPFNDIFNSRLQSFINSESPAGCFCSEDFLFYVFSNNTVAEPFSLDALKHSLYHALQPKVACALTRTESDLETMRGELEKVTALDMHNWASQMIASPFLRPPFLMGLDNDVLFQVLLGDISVYVYFDRARFVAFANSHAETRVLEMEFDPKKANDELTGISLKAYRDSAERHRLGWAMASKMMFELVDPANLLIQLLEVHNAGKRRGVRRKS